MHLSRSALWDILFSTEFCKNERFHWTQIAEATIKRESLVVGHSERAGVYVYVWKESSDFSPHYPISSHTNQLFYKNVF